MRDDPRLALLREAYATDVIDLETFERFVGHVLDGVPVALPVTVWPVAVEMAAKGGR